MEPEEHTDDDKEGDFYECAYCSEDEIYIDDFCFIDNGYDLLNQKGNLAGKRVDKSEDNVEKEEHEK